MRNITIEKDIKREKISVKISHEKSFDTIFIVDLFPKDLWCISVVCMMRQGDLYWRRKKHSKYLNCLRSGRMWILHQHDPIPSQIIEKVAHTNILFTVWISYCSTRDIHSYIVSLRWGLKALESITVKGKKCFPLSLQTIWQRLTHCIGFSFKSHTVVDITIIELFTTGVP